MERKTFKILFFIKKTRVSKNGEVPVLLRVTVNGLQTETSVNLKVNSDLWHNAAENITLFMNDLKLFNAHFLCSVIRLYSLIKTPGLSSAGRI